MLNVFSEFRQRANNAVRWIVGSGAPVDGTTGLLDTGPGSKYTDYVSGNTYLNTGTAAVPAWSLQQGNGAFKQTAGTISAADIVSVAAGKFGHAAGYPMVAAPGLHNVIELESVILHYDFLTAAFTAGGNITANWSAGGAALTGLVSAANSVAAATDKSVVLLPLATVGVALVENGGLNLVSSAAFTQPGTAAGVIRFVVNYRIHATGF